MPEKPELQVVICSHFSIFETLETTTYSLSQRHEPL